MDTENVGNFWSLDLAQNPHWNNILMQKILTHHTH
jgi:hypothetical protein